MSFLPLMTYTIIGTFIQLFHLFPRIKTEFQPLSMLQSQFPGSPALNQEP